MALLLLRIVAGNVRGDCAGLDPRAHRQHDRALHADEAVRGESLAGSALSGPPPRTVRSGLMLFSAYLLASRYWVYWQGSLSWCTHSSGAESSPNFALESPGPLFVGPHTEELRITRFASGAFMRAAWKALTEPSLVPTKVHCSTLNFPEISRRSEATSPP
jgi:hypothetical protein